MRRIGAIFSLSLLILLFTATFCFAGTLELVSSYPEDGGKGLQPVNCGVKLWFNEAVLSEENQAANEKCFQITDAKGKVLDSSVYYTPKEENLVLVLLDGTLKENSEYKLTVSEEFIAADGDSLAAPIEISFKTRDTSNDTKINMLMMVVMFGIIFFISSRAIKKQAANQAKEKEEKVDVYKLAKETGKPVEEIVEKIQKEKEKREAAAKKQSQQKQRQEKKDETAPAKDGNKRVRGPKPISAAGSTYITGRKAKAEEAARLAAERAAKAAANKKKGSKQQQKKKK